MNYINFNLLQSRGLTVLDYCLLIAASQNAREDLSNIISELIYSDERYEYLVEEGYLKFIKGNKSQNEFEKLRIDTKGKKLLEDASAAEVTDEDVTVFDWLENLYKKMGKEVGNRRKTKEYIAKFRQLSGIDKNRLVFLCKTFVKDDNEQEYSFKLENVFYKPKTHFNIHFDIEESRLYKYYLKRKRLF